jgi:hypothetical protein
MDTMVHHRNMGIMRQENYGTFYEIFGRHLQTGYPVSGTTRQQSAIQGRDGEKKPG